MVATDDNTIIIVVITTTTTTTTTTIIAPCNFKPAVILRASLKLLRSMEMRLKRQRLQAWCLIALQRTWHERHVAALRRKQLHRRLLRRFTAWRYHCHRMDVRAAMRALTLLDDDNCAL
jgi:hypothetical protein